MKRVLYASTALATAGILMGGVGNASAEEERIKIEVHGYHQQWGSVMAGHNLKDGAGQHPFDTNTLDQKHNSEICFTGEATLDSGLTVGVNVQLEANTSADQIDESYLYLSTPEVGRLIIGDENNAAYLLQVTAPDGGLSHNGANLSATQIVILPADFDVLDTTMDGTLLRFDDNDSGKFSFISPRFAGFQVGLSYIPNFESGGDNNNSISRVRPAGGGSKTGGAGDNPSGIKDGFAIGTNFTEKFGDIGLQASLGYMFGDTPPNEGSSNLQAASGGLQIAVAGFTVGGSYTWANGDKASQGGGQSYDGYSYDVGVAYSTGPYKIGLAYMRGESEGLRASSSKQHADYLILSGTYQLGPGVRWISGIYGFDLDGDDGATGAGQVASSDGWGATSGITLSF
ncbi:MAG: porin [Hyphomicrobiales bacterium]|nr:porin [Hyphomicrobiales bacterium]